MKKNYKKTNRLLKSRKAVSPLIATVLLIAFAVALGAVVMNWGRGYVEDTANMARERSDTEVTCASEVGIDLVDIDNTPQICYNSSGAPTGNNATLEFIMENRQSKEVLKMQVRLIGSATRVPLTLEVNESLSTNEAKFMNVTFDDGDGDGLRIGTIQQVKFTPYIRSGGSDVACPSSAEVASNIKPCSEVWT